MFEHLFKNLTLFLAAIVEGSAALIIAIAALEAMLDSLRLFIWRRTLPDTLKDDIRLRLGRWLALALEFELGADILRTAVAPTWDEIGKLGAIIILRTTLNYFLQKEINTASETKKHEQE